MGVSTQSTWDNYYFFIIFYLHNIFFRFFIFFKFISIFTNDNIFFHIEQKMKEYIIICKNTNKFKEDIKSKENIM